MSKAIISVTPDVLKDLMQMKAFLEMFSYAKDLKKYRPDIRIQAFIDARERQGGNLTQAQEQKRKSVIRDWFKLVIWYIRLRRASKNGLIHTSLLKLEQRAGPCATILHPLKKLKNLTQNDMNKYKGVDSDGEPIDGKEDRIEEDS